MGAPREEFGPYVVYEQIGLGGMATVHRAEAQGVEGFSKQVALKRMLPNVAADASLVKSFIREARLASNLRHGNVAQTYDLGKVGQTYFIAMELVPGRNLREILKHCSAVVGNMPLQIALNIVNQICDALDYAHNLCDDSGQPLGIIHRDVSPSNIIVSDGGVVKLIDFGIAKVSARGMNTTSGTIKGKLAYMAPEYLMGSIDARADLFAVGVIAHELLSNRPLFQGKDDMDTLYRVRDMPILPPSHFNPKVPPELDLIVMTALARDPEQRWQRAHALHMALTTEIKRLSLAAPNSQVFDWIDWAFQQKKSQFDEVSMPMISITPGTVEMPARASAPPRRREVPDEFSDPQDSLQTVVAAPPQSLLDTQRDRDRLIDTKRDHAAVPGRPSQNLVARNTPAPVPTGSEITDDVPTAAPRARDPRVKALIANAQTLLVPPDDVPHRPTPVRTLPGQGQMATPAPPPRPSSPALRPQGPVLSGMRTNVHMPRGDRTPLPAPAPVATVAQTRVEPHRRAGASNFLLAVLVLLAAGAAAAVVYFALPYLT